MAQRNMKLGFDGIILHHPIIAIVVVVLLISALGWMGGCANVPAEEAVESSETQEVPSATESVDTTPTEETQTDVHEMVYLPTEAMEMDDLFGEQGLWGVMIDDNPDVVVLHIGEGGIVDAEGNPIELSQLQAGDEIRCSFSMVTMSVPGQVSVDSAEFIGNGGQEAIAPYQNALAKIEESAIGVVPGPESAEG